MNSGIFSPNSDLDDDDIDGDKQDENRLLEAVVEAIVLRRFFEKYLKETQEIVNKQMS